jgi:hypothetical protein
MRDNLFGVADFRNSALRLHCRITHDACRCYSVVCI